MTGVFSRVFENPAVGADDDFFDLGGDSLLAASLMTEAEKVLGIRLAISALLEAPTPRLLGEAFAKALARRQSSCLVTVRPEGTATPLFCVHGVNGQPMFPRRLAASLHAGRPVYALRARGVETGEEPCASIEEMAEDFIREIREKQPAGPYLILGQCDPAVVALEMAQQLVAEGETVAGLILADPAVEHRSAPWLTEGGLSLVLIQNRLAKRAREIAEGMRNPAGFAERDRIPLIENILVDAAAAYTPQAYDGPTLLVCSAERKPVLLNPARGFQTYFRAFEAVETGPTHDSIFQDLSPDTAAAIDAFIGRVAAD